MPNITPTGEQRAAVWQAFKVLREAGLAPSIGHFWHGRWQSFIAFNFDYDEIWRTDTGAELMPDKEERKDNVSVP